MTIPITRAAEGLPRRAFTVADVERMVEVGLIAPDERLEIIGGEIVPMSPKGSRHEQIKIALTMLWGKACPDGFAFATETAFRPDPYNYLETGLHHLRPPGPACVPERAGPAACRRGGRQFAWLRSRPQSSALLGIRGRELWVVNAARRVTHVHLDPGPAGHGSTILRGADERLEPKFAPSEFAFVLDELERL